MALSTAHHQTEWLPGRSDFLPVVVKPFEVPFDALADARVQGPAQELHA